MGELHAVLLCVAFVILCGCTCHKDEIVAQTNETARREQNSHDDPEKLEAQSIGKLKAEADGVIALLREKMFERRQEATRRLLSIIRESESDQDAILDHLSQRLAQIHDPEANRRLERILDRFLRPWKLLKQTKVLQGHMHQIRSLAFSFDGKVLASAGGSAGYGDGTIRIWNPHQGKCLHVLEGHPGAVNCLQFHPSGSLLASGGEDKTVRIWDYATNECSGKLEGHTGSVLSLAFKPDGEVLATAGEDCGIRLWDLKRETCLRVLQDRRPVHSLAFDPTGKTILSGNSTGEICVWEADTGKRLRVLDASETAVLCLAFHPDGKSVAAGTHELVSIWDAVSWKCLCKFEASSDYVWSLCYSRDGKTLASSGRNGAKIWRPDTAECLGVLPGHAAWNRSVAFDPTCYMVALAAYRDVLLWEIPEE